MIRIAILLLAVLLGLPVAAQTFPAKPVRVIVVYPPGGTSDAVARLLAEKLAPALGQQLVVENRGGAGGAIGMDAMAKSVPDGHTIAFGAISPLTLLPHVGKVPYDALKDVVPLASVMYSPSTCSRRRPSPARISQRCSRRQRRSRARCASALRASRRSAT